MDPVFLVRSVISEGANRKKLTQINDFILHAAGHFSLFSTNAHTVEFLSKC